MKKVILGWFISAIFFVPTLSSRELTPLSHEIIGNGQYIVSDINLTIMGEDGDLFSSSSAYAPILDWLQCGGKLLAITSSTIERIKTEFWEQVPIALRCNGRVLLSTNCGAVLYYSDEKGNLIEDVEYRHKALSGGTVIKEANHLIDRIVTWLNDYYDYLEANPMVVEQLSEKARRKVEKSMASRNGKWTRKQLETIVDIDMAKIEIRRIFNTRDVVQITFRGVPCDLPLDFSSLGIEEFNLTLVKNDYSVDLLVQGVDKGLPLNWVMQSEKCELNPSRSFAMGDRPYGNDAGMIGKGLPFISVCEYPDRVPQSVRSLHIGGNQEGTKRVIEALVSEARRMDEQRNYAPVIPSSLERIVHSIQASS